VLRTVHNLDEAFDTFYANMLNFPYGFRNSPHAQCYLDALTQLRFDIKEGGIGLTAAQHVAPAAHYAASLEFALWLSEPSHDEIKTRIGLAYVTDNLHNGGKRLEEISDVQLVDHYDPNWALSKQQIPSASALFSWPNDKLPNQKSLTKSIKKQLRDGFASRLSITARSRLLAVSKQFVPAKAVGSHLAPLLNSDDKDTLAQTPMALHALSSTAELSNNAFITFMSVQLGIPIPHTAFMRSNIVGYDQFDDFGHMMFNNSTHGSRSWTLAHDSIACELAGLACESGITASVKAVPTLEGCRDKGDLVTLRGGAVPTNSNMNFDISITRVVLDVTLVHAFDSHGAFKKDNLKTAANTKDRHYRDGYLRQGLASAPAACNTLGQLEPEFLRFLFNCADQAARRATEYIPPTHNHPNSQRQDEVLSCQFVALRGRTFNTYRTMMLLATAEAATQRLYGRSFALACDSRYKAWMDHHKEPWIPVFHEPSRQVDLPPAAPGRTPPLPQTGVAASTASGLDSLSTPSASTPSTSSRPESVSLMPEGSVNVSHRREVGEPSSHSPSAAHSYAGVVRRGSSLGMEDSSAS